ncbi:hypothetical protein, partial [Geomonas sp.]|uniref:hypothetical protein n=1 Tax=Geomonas sp. TaxID=2651584 RepID=UPI002B486709
VDFTGQLKMLYWNRQFKTPLSLASSQTLGAFHLEEGVDYGTIDSVKAYDQKIDFWSVGGAVDWNALKQLTITGGYWHYWASDGNHRDKVVARASYSITDNFLLQYRYKGIWNAKQVPQYFSPEVFNQHAFLLGYADSFWDSVRVKLMAGPVWQDDGFQKSTGALEDVRVTWRFLELWSLTAHLEADQVGSGYQYLYSTLALTRDF